MNWHETRSPRCKISLILTVWKSRSNRNLDIINQVYKKAYEEGTSGLMFHHGNRSSGDVLQWGLVCFWCIMKKWDLMLICTNGRRCIWPISLSNKHESFFIVPKYVWLVKWRACLKLMFRVHSDSFPCDTRKELNNLPFKHANQQQCCTESIRETTFSQNDSKRKKKLSQIFALFHHHDNDHS